MEWQIVVALIVAVPVILFPVAFVWRSRNAVFWTSVLVITGLVLNRFNVSMLVLDMRPGTIYFPHWMEFAISAGLVADALLVIWLAHRFLPITSHKEVTAETV